MENTKYYMDKLKILKNKLVDNLNIRGIDAIEDETLNSLIPKIELITEKATEKQQFPDFSLAYCDLPEEDINNLMNLLELTNPSTDIKGKFRDIPNLKTLKLNDLGISTIDSSDSTTFANTPLETLDLSNTRINTYALLGPTLYGNNNQNYPYSNSTLPQTLTKLKFTNAVYNSNYLPLYGLKNLTTIEDLNTVTFEKPITSLSCSFCSNPKLTEIDLSGITLSDSCTTFYAVFRDCTNLEHIVPPKNFPTQPTNMLDMFIGCGKLSWEEISNFINWDVIDLSKIRTDNHYLAGMFYINLSNYTTEEEYINNGECLNDYPREIEYIRWKKEWVPWNPLDFFGSYIKTLDFSNFTDYEINKGFLYLYEIHLSWLPHINGTEAVLPIIQCDTLNLKNSSFILKSFGGNYSWNSNRYFKRPTKIELENTTFIMKDGPTSFEKFTNHQWLEDYDFSNLTLYFSEEFTGTYFTFYNCVNYSKVTEGQTFKLPKLEGPKVPKIDSIAISSGTKNFSVVDLSTVPYDTFKSIGGLNFPKATYVDIGPNYGKGFTGITSNNSINFGWLSNNNVIAKEHVINIFNKLYDLNITFGVYDADGNPGTGTLYTQSIDLHADVISQLTPEEIAIVTNKGWTVK